MTSGTAHRITSRRDSPPLAPLGAGHPPCGERRAHVRDLPRPASLQARVHGQPVLVPGADDFRQRPQRGIPVVPVRILMITHGMILPG